MVKLADGVGSMKGLKPGEEAVVTYGPDRDGDFKVRRVSEDSELRYFKKHHLKLVHFRETTAGAAGSAGAGTGAGTCTGTGTGTSDKKMAAAAAAVRYEAIFSSPSRRARWVVFEGSGGSSAAASVLSALVALQAVCRARYVRSVRIPALKEQAYNDLLQKILGRVAPLLQAMARGRFNNNKH